MSRISIDVTEQEHRQLKALAALQGKSVKDFVLAQTLGSDALKASLDEVQKQVKYAYDGEVNEEFKRDSAEQFDAHSDVLDGLSR